MSSIMTNNEVQVILSDCHQELESIKALLTGLGAAANPTPYIKKYAVIRASGSIETAFKKIIADRIDSESNIQVKNFIKRKIRDSSCNPKLSQIENMLTEFDSRWRNRFDEQISLDDKPRLKGSLTVLVDARNDFAHGGNPDLDIDNTIQHFLDGVRVITILDAVLQHNYDDE
ncbi:HEPN domain-containing protein [Aeromonas jandaei]|uniref:HEPN domain-containing protein n=1 Tax=Aeromonas jandaei TaxID=650 RepID=UPI003BA3D148